MSKEWTINSFWIEEELRGFLSNQSHIKEQDTHMTVINKDTIE